MSLKRLPLIAFLITAALLLTASNTVLTVGGMGIHAPATGRPIGPSSDHYPPPLCTFATTTGTQTYLTDAGPFSIASDGDGGIWVLTRELSQPLVNRLKDTTGAILASYVVGDAGSNVITIAYDYTQNAMWFNDYGHSEVIKKNASTGATIGTYAVGTNPYQVIYSPVDNSVWTSNITTHNVTKLSAFDGGLIGTYSTANSPIGLAFDDAGFIWVGSNLVNNNITKLNASTGASVGTYSAGTAPIGLTFQSTPPGYLWACNNGDSTVTKFLASSGAVIGTYTAPAGCHVGGVTFDGTFIWMTGSAETRVQQTLASTGAVSRQYTPVSGGPGLYGTQFDGKGVWVADYYANRVYRMDGWTEPGTCAACSSAAAYANPSCDAGTQNHAPLSVRVGDDLVTAGMWQEQHSGTVAPTATLNYAQAPDCTTTASRLQIPATTNSTWYNSVYIGWGTAITTWSTGIWVKGNTGNSGTVDFCHNISTGSGYHCINATYNAATWTWVKDENVANSLHSLHIGNMTFYTQLRPAQDILVWGAQATPGATLGGLIVNDGGNGSIATCP